MAARLGAWSFEGSDPEYSFESKLVDKDEFLCELAPTFELRLRFGDRWLRWRGVKIAFDANAVTTTINSSYEVLYGS